MQNDHLHIQNCLGLCENVSFLPEGGDSGARAGGVGGGI